MYLDYSPLKSPSGYKFQAMVRWNFYLLGLDLFAHCNYVFLNGASTEGRTYAHVTCRLLVATVLSYVTFLLDYKQLSFLLCNCFVFFFNCSEASGIIEWLTIDVTVIPQFLFILNI